MGTRAGKGTAATIGTSELAGQLGISRQRVNELGRAGRITRERDGRWDPEKVRVALGRNLDSRQKSPARDRATKPVHGIGQHRDAAPVPKKGTLLYEQWRHTREKADREALDRRKLEGELVEAAAVQHEWAGIGVKLRDAVMGLSSRVCNRLPAEWRREVVAVLDDEARKMLSALSDDIKAGPEAIPGSA